MCPPSTVEPWVQKPRTPGSRRQPNPRRFRKPERELRKGQTGGAFEQASMLSTAMAGGGAERQLSPAEIELIRSYLDKH
jgi:hypothetical protein